MQTDSETLSQISPSPGVTQLSPHSGPGSRNQKLGVIQDDCANAVSAVERSERKRGIYLLRHLTRLGLTERE